jgi:ubiquitin carboxyl-terminal hydrolase
MKLLGDEFSWTISNLFSAIEAKIGVSASDMIATQIHGREITVLEGECPIYKTRKTSAEITVYHLEPGLPSVWASLCIYTRGGYCNPVGFPLLISVKDPESPRAEIQNLFKQIITRIFPETDSSKINWESAHNFEKDYDPRGDGRFPRFLVWLYEKDWNVDHESLNQKLSLTIIVHLERFTHSSEWTKKIDLPVSFPIDGLDFGSVLPHDRLEQCHLYDLFAISNHYGESGEAIIRPTLKTLFLVNGTSLTTLQLPNYH